MSRICDDRPCSTHARHEFVTSVNNAHWVLQISLAGVGVVLVRYMLPLSHSCCPRWVNLYAALKFTESFDAWVSVCG